MAGRSAVFTGLSGSPKIVEAFAPYAHENVFKALNRLELRYVLNKLESDYKKGQAEILPTLEAARKAYADASASVVKMGAPVYPELTLPNKTEEIQAAYDYLCSGITFKTLYNALIRGHQPRLSKKMLGELYHCRVAMEHFTQEQFDHVNPHKLAMLVWRLIQSDELDDADFCALANVIDRTPNRKTAPLIHHQPEIMEHFWLVEAFNNRNNSDYDPRILAAAKAMDTDLIKMKLFIHDIQLLPRRLNLLLCLHHIKTNHSFPAKALAPFFNALYDYGYVTQIPTFLAAAVTLTPGQVVPREAIAMAIRSAAEFGDVQAATALMQYIRVMYDIPMDTVVRLPADAGVALAVAFHQANVKAEGDFILDPDHEANVLLSDLLARGEIAPVLPEPVSKAFSVGKEPFVVDVSEFIDENKFKVLMMKGFNDIINHALSKDKASVSRPVAVKVAGYKALKEHYNRRRVWKPTEVVNNCEDEDATSLVGDIKLTTDDKVIIPPRSMDPKVELNNLLTAFDMVDKKPAEVYDRDTMIDDKDYEALKPYLPEEIRGEQMVNDVADVISMRFGIGELSNPDRIDPITTEIAGAFLHSRGLEYTVDELSGWLVIPPESFEKYVNLYKIRAAGVQ